MPKVNANGITLNYEQEGSGEPLILIPYLSADNACYAFQVAEYAKHFTCISSICAAPAKATNRRASILLSYEVTKEFNQTTLSFL